MRRTKDELEKWIIDTLDEMDVHIAGSIDKEDSFADYGITSAQAIVLIEKLKEYTGEKIDMDNLWRYSSISEFIDAICGNGDSKETQVADNKYEANIQDSFGKGKEYAIIGIGCHFSEANSADEFWKNLSNGKNSIKTRQYGESTLYGGFIDEIDEFDNRFFRISPIEAESMDPQQRHLLEVTWEAFEDAQIRPEDYSGKEVGVFVGISGNDYGNEIFAYANNSDIYGVTGNSHAIAANRLSYFYNFIGPSMSIDTACSSSLVAAHYACLSLQNGDCELAVVAGANAILNDDITNVFEASRMLSPDHKCKTFDNNANGYVRGEGIGVVILKEKSLAIKDGNHIYATILGSAINQDGKSNGLTAPNLKSQVKVINKALRNANVGPDDIQYVEAHGTGTNLGDPIEVAALNEAICDGKNESLRIGSVKTNIGHLEAAAGIASIIKVSLCLQHKKYVPSLNFTKINEKIAIAEDRIKVQTELEDWKTKDRRHAGISSFGFGGTNAHLIIAEAFTENENSTCVVADSDYGIGMVLPISAKSKESLAYNEKVATEFVEENRERAFEIVNAYSKGKSHFDNRAAFTIDRETGKAKRIPAKKDKTAYKVAFVFSGQGPGKLNWPCELNKNKYFNKKLTEIDELFADMSGWSIKEVLEGTSDKEFENTDVAQPVIFAVQVSIAYMLEQYGITPEGVIGHSLGEVAAAAVSSKLSLKDALNVIYIRSTLMQRLKGKGRMLSIDLPKEEVEELIKNNADTVRVAVVNAKDSCVISGPQDILEEIKEDLNKKEIRNILLGVLYPFHGAEAESLQEEMEKKLKRIRVKTGEMTVYSTVTANKANARTFGAKYWSNQVYQPVMFNETVSNMVDDGYDYFIEINTQALLSSYITKEYDDVETVCVLNKKMSQMDSLSAVIGKSYVYHLPINWDKYYACEIKWTNIPPYSWDKKKYWFKASSQKVGFKEIIFANETAKELTKDDDVVASWFKRTVAETLHLDVSEIHDDDKLIELGIDSIMAYSIKNKVESKYSCNLPVTLLINDVTVEDIEEFIRGNKSIYQEIEDDDIKPDISDMQSLLWTIYKAEPSNCAYNQVFSADITGNLNVQILKQVIEQLLIDHLELRACFKEAEGEVKKTILDVADTDYFYYDEANIYTDEELSEKIADIENTPFVLEEGNLFKIYLFQKEDDHTITVCAHHTVIDLASIETLLLQLVQNYQKKVSTGEVSNYKEKKYDKFILEHKSYMDSWDGKKDHYYWSEKLAGTLPIIDLAVNNRPEHITYEGSVYRNEVDPGTSVGIKDISKNAKITPSAFLMAAYYVLLYKYTGEKDIIVGMSASLRNDFKCQNTVGDFVNLLPIRVPVDSQMSFLEFASMVKTNIIEAIDHQRYPFKRMLEDASTVGQKGISPIVQVAFSQEILNVGSQSNLSGFITGHDTKFDFAGLTLRPRPSNVRYSPYDLLLMADTSSDQINLSWQYNTNIISESFIRNMASHFNNILTIILDDTNKALKDIHILNADEYSKLFTTFNDVPDSFDDRLLIDAFEETVAKYHDNIAISKDGQKYTYDEFNKNINRTGRYLTSMGLTHGDCVALCLNKSIQTMELMFAIIKIGCVYVPIDPGYPANRIQFILDSTKAKVVFAEKELACELPDSYGGIVTDLDGLVSKKAEFDFKNICHPIASDDLAYIIFTSGTTGKPKGVMIEHVGICNMVRGLNNGWGVQSDSKVLQFASLSFDASIAEIFITLLSGAELVLKDKQDIFPGGDLECVLRNERITNVILTPSVLMLTDANGLIDLRSVLSAGESCNSTVIKKWAAGRRFVNAYGPTESTVCATYKICKEDDFDNVTIGNPIEGTKIYVLDDDLNPVPIGMLGELCITSIGLARGYFNAPELTSDKFVENTVDKTGFSRMYRTSDIVRYTNEGEIRFIGRKDNQVKIRGFRIELDEVENVLNKCPGVKEGTVIVKEISGDKRLVAFVCASDDSCTEENIKISMKESIPQYMMPSHFEFVDELPHSISGKVDKKVVDTFEISIKSIEVDDSGYTDTQKSMRKIWCDVLGYDGITLEDDFYEAGGHSLLASQLKTKVENRFGISIEMTEILDHSKLVDFCELVESKKTNDQTGKNIITQYNELNYIPVTYAQNRLIFLNQINKDSTEYNIAGDLILSGELNEDVFKEAFKNVIRKNHSLRTVFFRENGRYYQRITDDLENYGLDVIYEDDQEKVSAYIDKIIHWKFDLFTGPLIKAGLIRTNKNEYILVFSVHHIISDGWSVGLMVNMWSDEYNYLINNEVQEETKELQFSDYAIWSSENIQGKRLKELEDYWNKRLKGSENDVIGIVNDYPRPDKQTNHGKQLTIKIDKQITSDIHRLCNETHTTVFMVLLSSFDILLNKLTGEFEFNIGIPVAGRNIEDTQGMIGMFINTVVNHTKVDSEAIYSNFLANVRKEIISDIEHQDMPFERVVELLNPARNMSYSPLFQILFNMLNINEPKFHLKDVESIGREQLDHDSKYDMTIYATDDKEISIEFLYNADIYSESHIELIADQYCEVLRQISSKRNIKIRDIDLSEANSISVSNTKPADSLKSMIVKNFSEYREKVAIRKDDCEITYSELERNALSYASFVSEEIGDEIIYLYASRDEQLIYAVLGCVLADKTFAIVDSRYPINRVQSMLSAIPNSIILDISEGATLSGSIDKSYQDKLLNYHEPKQEFVLQDSDKEAFYVIFTSGTTGEPKSVKSSVLALAHFISWYRSEFGVKESDVFSVLSGLSHDPIMRDLLVPICSGASLCIPTEDVLIVPHRLNSWINKNSISVIHQTPSLLRMMSTDTMESVRLIGFGGEKLTHSSIGTAKELLPNARLLNFYGASETPQVMAFYDVTANPEGVIPIGKGIDDVELVIVDSNHNATGTMCIGEIAVMTDYLAEGYISGAPKVTPFGVHNGIRTYFTGDVGYKDLDGNIVLLSRNDNQLKNRGFRVEPVEVEDNIVNCDGIRTAKVMSVNGKLTAFVVTDFKKDINQNAIKKSLLKNIPLYMVPDEFICVESIPLTVNGKCDERRLKELVVKKNTVSTISTENFNTTDIITHIWKKVLKLDNIGINDNFFDIGGYSFLLLELYEKLSDVIDKKFEIVDLFQYPTIKSFADYLDGSESAQIIYVSHRSDTEQKKEALRNKRKRRDRSAV